MQNKVWFLHGLIHSLSDLFSCPRVSRKNIVPRLPSLVLKTLTLSRNVPSWCHRPGPPPPCGAVTGSTLIAMISPRARCVIPRKILSGHEAFSEELCLQMSLLDEHWRRARVRHVHVSRGRHVERPRGRASWWPLVPSLAPGPGLWPGLLLLPWSQPRLQPQHGARDPVPLLRGLGLGLTAGQARGLGPVLPHVWLHPHSHGVLQVRSYLLTLIYIT